MIFPFRDISKCCSLA